MEQKKSGVFFGGVPTAPDVKRLMDAMPKWGWVQGDIIPYSKLEEACQLKRGTHRFNAVVGVWRKRLLREGNIDLAAVTGVGLKWLLEEERLRAGVRDNGRAVRGQGRALQRVVRTQVELLTEADKRHAEHARRIMESTYLASRGAAKEIAMVFAPVKALPFMQPGVWGKKEKEK